MRLYHFTCLLHLPWIMKQGITKGEVPTGPIPYRLRPQAANLTRDPDLNHQSTWILDNHADKTKIRITVEVPDTSVTSFRDMRERYRIKSSYLKKLDPTYQRPNWFFAFGGVSPDQFLAVEIREGRTYRTLSDDELRSLVARIEEERDSKLEFLPDDGTLPVKLKDGFSESWLIDGALIPWMAARRNAPAA